MGNLSKPISRLNLCTLDNLCSKIFGNLLFVELTQDNLTQLCRDNTWMQVVFARDVDTEYIRIPDVDIVCFLKVELYSI